MTKEHIAKIVSSKGFLVGATAAISLAAGGFVGYKLAYKKADEYYDDIATTGILEAKKYYAQLHKTGEYADPTKLAQDRHIEITEIQGYTAPSDTFTIDEFNDVQEAIEAVQALNDPADQSCEIEEPVTENVFAKSTYDGEEFDYDLEMANRSRDVPYVLTSDEFFQNEDDRNQTNLTFFEGDGVLVDEADVPIQEPDRLVGLLNLDRFGVGSGDKNVLYIRNEKLDLEFEIIRSEQLYTEAVLGFIEHADTRGKIRKFRGDDE